MARMGRRKTTVHLDPDVLTATKVLAAARQLSESQVVEDALREYLGGSRLESARANLIALMERVATRANLSDDDAMTLAVEEVQAVRRARRSRRSA